MQSFGDTRGASQQRRGALIPSSTHRAIAAAIALLTLSLTSAPEVAAEDVGGSFGPMLGGTFGQPSGAGLTFGGELVMGVGLIDERFPVWTAFGWRGVLDDGALLHRPYVEAGFWALLSLGVGYGPELSEVGAPRHLMHLFIGAPLPPRALGDGEDAPLLYVEPYWRPLRPLERRARWQHEAGLMLKVTLWG